MPSKTLTDLAPELLIQILKSSDKFADVTSLSSISRKMFIIWKTNIGVICDAILARTVPCYAQARELMEAQEEAPGNGHSSIGYLSAVDRARWMLKGAEIATKALAYFEDDVFLLDENGSLIERESLTPAERTDFTRAYYRATTLATMGEDSLPTRLLSSWNLLDLEQVRDVMAWLMFWDGGHEDKFGAVFEWRRCDPTPGVKGSKSWAKACGTLTELNSVLSELTPKPDQGSKSETFFFPFRARGRHPDERKTNSGAPLADLLNLVREKGTCFNVTYKLSEA